jgi:hypothetical protein
MLRRLLLALVAAAALATSASVLVVALAFTLYAFVEPFVGRSGAAATVAGAAAVLIGLMGMMIAMMARPKRSKRALSGSKTVGGGIDRIIGMVREKPLMTVSAAIGAGFMAVRNPGYLGAAIRAFLDGRPASRRR